LHGPRRAGGAQPVHGVSLLGSSRHFRGQLLAPIGRNVDLNRGESQRVTLSDGSAVNVRLIAASATKDTIREAVRSAQADVEPPRDTPMRRISSAGHGGTRSAVPSYDVMAGSKLIRPRGSSPPSVSAEVSSTWFRLVANLMLCFDSNRVTDNERHPVRIAHVVKGREVHFKEALRDRIAQVAVGKAVGIVPSLAHRLVTGVHVRPVIAQARCRRRAFAAGQLSVNTFLKQNVLCT
jgi:hypothetical protein